MRKKQPSKIKPKLVETVKSEGDTSLFHEVFPLTLEYLNDKDKKICYFQCKEHLDSYVKRNKLNKKQYKLSKTLPR
jgi:hypothetical protein